MDDYMEMPDKEGKTVWTKKEESKDGSWVETKVEKTMGFTSEKPRKKRKYTRRKKK